MSWSTSLDLLICLRINTKCNNRVIVYSRIVYQLFHVVWLFISVKQKREPKYNSEKTKSKTEILKYLLTTTTFNSHSSIYIQKPKDKCAYMVTSVALVHDYNYLNQGFVVNHKNWIWPLIRIQLSWENFQI